jgi:Virulence protein
MVTDKLQRNDSQFILYQDDNGVTNVNVRFDGNDVWLSQQQIAMLFDTTRENIVQHIRNIYQEIELQEERTCKKFLQVQLEGSRSVKRSIPNYNLDMIIALGYRVKSQVATRFRQWATLRLHEYIQKGFTLDDERLKGSGNRCFRELLQRIRDIRSSERNLYQQVTDIYATAVDYDPNADITRQFFAVVQNKMHYAVHQHTAAEIIYQRVDANKPMVGMSNFKGD